MLKKRFSKFTAIALMAVLCVSMFVPSMALAHHRYRHHSHWSSGDTWALAGGLGLIGYLASRSYSAPVIVDYDTHKANFIRNLDTAESALYLQIRDIKPGEYYIEYTKGSTVRRIKKFCKNLPRDYEYVGVDKKAKIVYFNRLDNSMYEE